MVHVETVDDFLAERLINRVDIIKMDIEGAEPLVLKGMEKTFAANPGLKVILEFSTMNLRVAGFDPLEILRTIESQGFTAKSIDDNKILSATAETISEIEQKNNSFVNVLISK